MNFELYLFKDGAVKAKYRSRDVGALLPEVKTVQDVANVMFRMASQKLCEGAKNLNMYSVWPSAQKRLKVWYSEACEVIVTNASSCQPCSDLKTMMIKHAEECLHRKPAPIPKKFAEKLLQIKKRKKLADLRLFRLKQRNKHLKEIQSKFLKTKEPDLVSAIKESNLPENMKCAMLQSARFAKAKSKYARR